MCGTKSRKRSMKITEISIPKVSIFFEIYLQIFYVLSHSLKLTVNMKIYHLQITK